VKSGEPSPRDTVPVAPLIPDFAEFIIGPAEGRTRWLNPGYKLNVELYRCICMIWSIGIML
jgi:hypothetical protein